MLRMLTENTAYIHKEAKYMKKRFIEIITPPKKEEDEEPERTADDVLARVKAAITGKRA